MKLTPANDHEFDNLVFEKRNKSYGAYALRKVYEDNLLLSLLISVTIFAGIFAVPYIVAYFRDTPVESIVPEKVKEKIFEIFNPPPDKPAGSNSAGSTGEGKKSDNNFKEIVDSLEADIDTTVTDEKGFVFRPGTDPGDGEIPCIDCGTGKGPEKGPGTEKKNSGTGYGPVQVMPQFPGGDEALAKFLSNNIRYPQIAKENGVQGTVYVSFIVDQYGHITQVETLRGIGGNCDEEAERVVKLMPRWTPGKQNGHGVKVQYHLPIRFVIH